MAFETFDPRWRWVLLLIPAAAVVAWNWHEPVLILLIMLAPLVRVGMLYDDDPRRRIRAPLMTLGIAVGVALAMHLGAVRMLDGHLIAGEVIWTAWFYAGCLVLLEGLDRGMAWAVHRMENEALRSVVRLVVILAVVIPAVVAIMQTVRVKVGYDIPPAAQALAPIHFETRAADGVPIRGMYFDRGHDTTLVVAHGLGAHAQNFLPFLTPLLEQYPVNGLIFDFRAHGYSGGHATSFGYHERKDLQAALAWLEQRDADAADNLIFYGFSMGAAATVAVAAETPETRGVIIDSGFARLTDVARAMADQLPAGLAQYVYYTGLPLASALTSAPLHQVQPVRDVERLDVPLRVLHGAADALFPADQGRELLERGRGTGRIVPGGEHMGLADADPAYARRVGRFIELLLPDWPPDDDEDPDARPPREPGIGPPPE